VNYRTLFGAGPGWSKTAGSPTYEVGTTRGMFVYAGCSYSPMCKCSSIDQFDPTAQLDFYGNNTFFTAVLEVPPTTGPSATNSSERPFTKITDCKDGSSNTILIPEVAGKPQLYYKGALQTSTNAAWTVKTSSDPNWLITYG